MTYVDKPKNFKKDNLSLIWNTTFRPTREKQFENSQELIDLLCMNYSTIYMPKDKNTSIEVWLAKNSLHLGDGYLQSGMIYNRRNFYNPQFNFQGAPLRGGYWWDRMKTTHKKDIQKKVGVILK